MSQHTYQTQYKGQEARILMGFDRPMQAFFMDINLKTRFETIPLYASSKDPELQGSFGMSKSIDIFCKRLVDLELSIPEAMLLAVQKDGEDNAGNVVMDHGSSTSSKPKRVPPMKVGQIQGGSVYASTFPNGRLALYLQDGLSGRLSINVPDIDLQVNQTLLKLSPYDPSLRDQLLGLGVFKETGIRYEVGFDEMELWEFETAAFTSVMPR